MPIFEYQCRGCGNSFEILIRGEERARCPACNGTRLDKQLSVFATTTGGSAGESRGPAACSTCGDPRGPGACSLD